MIAVRLFTEQCLQCKLQRSVTIIVPNIGFRLRNNTVLNPKRENFNKVDAFMTRDYTTNIFPLEVKS